MYFFYDGGFYIDGLHTIPEGAVELSDEAYQALIDGQAAGKIILADDSGYPVLADPAPSPCHVFVDGEWVLSPDKQAELLAAQRAQMREAINALRDAKINGGVYVPEIDKWIDSDARAERNLLSTKASFDLLGDELDITWTCADNTTIKLDKATMLQVWVALMANKQQNHANALAHKHAIDQSENPLEYDYSAGWTTTYADFVAGAQNG